MSKRRTLTACAYYWFRSMPNTSLAGPVRGPTVVAFLHLERTGGTSIMASVRLQPAVHILSYPRTHCFFMLHIDIFPWARSFIHKRKECTATLPTNSWKEVPRLFVEFHSWSAFKFAAVVEARHLLQQRYSEVDGTFLTLTVFREPVALAASVYRFMPPYIHGSRKREIVPFADWIRRSAAGASAKNSSIGLQFGRMLNLHSFFTRSARNKSIAGANPSHIQVSNAFKLAARNCHVAGAWSQEANATLHSLLHASFSVLGTTEHLSEAYNTAMRCVGWQTARLRTRIISSSGWWINSTDILRRLNASERAFLGYFTACDRVLWTEASSRQYRNRSTCD